MGFIVNQNREFTNGYKNVLNQDTNEVLAFPATMSDDEVSMAIESDKEGRPMSDVNPTFYDAHVRPAMEQAKLTGNNEILYAARRKELDQDPFLNAVKGGFTFGLLTNDSPEAQAAMKAAPIETFVGNLVGQTGSILATAGVGEAVFGASKVAQGLGLAARGATPLAIRQSIVGSGEILAKTGGAVIQKTVQNAAGAGMLGAMYEGISESARQGKAMYDDVDGKLQQDSPDLVKIGGSILHGLGWSAYGIGGPFMGKTATGLTVGSSAVAGTAFVLSKAEGHTDGDAFLNAMVMGAVHAMPHIVNPDERLAMLGTIQDNFASYIKGKNQFIAQNGVHDLASKEFMETEAQKVLDDKANADGVMVTLKSEDPVKEVAQSPELTQTLLQNIGDKVIYPGKAVNRKAAIAPQFTDGNKGDVLDYLAQYFPAREVALMTPEKRLELANAPWQTLRDLSTQRETTKPVEDLMAAVDQNPALDPKEKISMLKILGLKRQAIEDKNVAKAVIPEAKPEKVSRGTFDKSQPIQGKASAEGSQKPSGSVDVSKPIVPIQGEGATKTRGLSAGVEAKAIEAKLTTGFGDLPEYQSVNMKDQAAKAAEFLAKDYELAKKVAMGQEPSPKDLIPESVFLAVENRAIKEGDVNTLRDLATKSTLTTEATTMGQRIRTLGERDPESPVGAIKSIEIAREKVAVYRSKSKSVTKEKNRIAKEIKDEIKKASPKLTDWQKFVESIKC